MLFEKTITPLAMQTMVRPRFGVNMCEKRKSFSSVLDKLSLMPVKPMGQDAREAV